MSDSPEPDTADRPDPAVDVERVRAAIADHPVRLAVLFGSQVTDGVDANSDVDIAVEFRPTVDDRGQALLSLLADLSVALDRNDIDLAVVDDLAPRVGRAAFTHGTLLMGSGERADSLRRRFEERVTADRSDRSLRERFDETVDHVDRLVESGD
jgi:predicted nucleotidyltransferase